MMTSVVAKINALGVAVEHIPGGCTGLLQPVDVGIGKPLKCRVKQRWSDWMIEKEATDAFKPPSRELLSKWIIDSLSDLPRDLIKQSWRSSAIKYFDE